MVETSVTFVQSKIFTHLKITPAEKLKTHSHWEEQWVNSDQVSMSMF